MSVAVCGRSGCSVGGPLRQAGAKLREAPPGPSVRRTRSPHHPHSPSNPEHEASLSLKDGKTRSQGGEAACSPRGRRADPCGPKACAVRAVAVFPRDGGRPGRWTWARGEAGGRAGPGARGSGAPSLLPGEAWGREVPPPRRSPCECEARAPSPRSARLRAAGAASSRGARASPRLRRSYAPGRGRRPRRPVATAQRRPRHLGSRFLGENEATQPPYPTAGRPWTRGYVVPSRGPPHTQLCASPHPRARRLAGTR